MATRVHDPRVDPLGLIDMTVDRNAFGRQKESFEADIVIEGLDGSAFHAVFIRAPLVTTTGNSVKIASRNLPRVLSPLNTADIWRSRFTRNSGEIPASMNDF